MKTRQFLWVVILWMLFLGQVPASVLYVDLNSATPTVPYVDWTTAATSIQDAIDVSSDGDLILVTNGVYQTGGRVVVGSLTNRVVVNKGVTVQSVNGPAVTIIQGYQVPGTVNGDAAIRCVYLASGATLAGFTLAGGATLDLFSGDIVHERSGGGVWCESTSGLVSNCIVIGNSCFVYGAGVYSGTITDCQIINNTNRKSINGGGGGGAAFALLFDCTISGNQMVNGDFGGGASSCSLSNCVITGNLGSGAYGCTLSYCMVSSNSDLNNGGGACQSALDHCFLFGNRATNSGGGAYDCTLNFCTISNNWAHLGGGGIYAASVPFGANSLGQTNTIVGNFGGGGGGAALNQITGLPALVLTNWTFISNSAVGDGGGLTIGSPQWVVNDCTFSGNSAGGNGGGLAGYPGSSPITVVSNCTFTGNTAGKFGGGVYNATLINSSVAGNQAGSGGGIYGWPNGCVMAGNIAITNGGGMFWDGVNGLCLNSMFTNNLAANGGGAYNALFCTFSNCVFFANYSSSNGGGIWAGSAFCRQCLVVSNQAISGGGMYSAFVFMATNCTLMDNYAISNGGGAYGGTIGRCFVSGNYAGSSGGGTYGSSLYASTIANNVAGTNGGGSYNSSMIDSLVTSNSAAYGGGACLGSLQNSTIVNNRATVSGGGIYFTAGATVTSCIIYDNVAPSGTNFSGGTTYNNCCTVPLPSGGGNITNNPVFVNPAEGNFRLQTNSTCINTGNGIMAGAFDLDRRPRVVGGRIDIGAYEFQAAGIGEFIAWLQQYGLPTDGTADFTDADGDGFNNWNEWHAGTSPKDPSSLLKMATATNDVSGITVTWQSVSGITYFLQNSTNLGTSPAFSTIQTGIAGQVGTTSYTDTTATNGGPHFYRVGVQ